MHASPTERHFAIERKDDRSHIGNASIHDIDWVSRNAWFGLFIGEPTAWNRGFGSDAIATMVRFAFDDMNLMKLRINVFDYNDRAKHVLEGRGFVQEDVDAIGLSILSGAHNVLFPEIMRLLKEEGAEDIVVFAGGIIPEQDIPKLKSMGIKEIFLPGTPTSAAVAAIRNAITS